MRKTLMIFLALVLVCGCGAALAAQAVSAPREEILSILWAFCHLEKLEQMF